MKSQKVHWQEAIALGVVWAVVGCIYSTILLAMLAFFQRHDVGTYSIGLATALAGMVGALFYGSVRLAFLASLAALIAAFGYLYFIPVLEVTAENILLVSALAGVIVGGHYGHLIRESRVCRAPSKALTGLYAGFVAGLPLVVLDAWLGPVGVGPAAVLATALTGVLYIFNVRRMAALMQLPVSAVFSGALVGGGVAAMVGIAVWAFIGSFDSTLTGAATPAVRFAWANWPAAAAGGAGAGFVAGVAMARAGFRWTLDSY